MRQFSPVVDALVLSVLDPRQHFAFRRSIDLELVGHNNPRDVVKPLEQLAEAALGGVPVTAGLNQDASVYPS